MSTVSKEQKAIEFLKSLGYTVTKKQESFKSTKLPYVKESLPEVLNHFNSGRKVRFNFGTYKGKWVVEVFTTAEEMRKFSENNSNRLKYVKSVSLL